MCHFQCLLLFTVASSTGHHLLNVTEIFVLQGKSKFRVKLTTEVGSDDGFGFTIKGGKDKCSPIIIESITNGKIVPSGLISLSAHTDFFSTYGLFSLSIYWSQFMLNRCLRLAPSSNVCIVNQMRSIVFSGLVL